MREKENQPEIGEKLISWYKKNKREMPWRQTKDPYTIWLSEIILQQTRVIQGTPYFEKFIDEFPTLKHLAEASEDKVLKLWQGLGYYSRARNLLETARYIYFDLNGVFPNTFKDLLKLKGVGDYTAAAIASIAYNQAVAVVDGNVIRVISRLYKIEDAFDSAKGKKIIRELAHQILYKSDPAAHNQAIMELGSLVCRPQNPDCIKCPIAVHCLAGRDGKMLSYPVKSKKTLSKTLFFNFIVALLPDGKTLLTKRTANDIWKNMYTFPLYETNEDTSENDFIPVIANDFKDFELLKVVNLKHVLSHRLIFASFYLITLKENEDFMRRDKDFEQHILNEESSVLEKAGKPEYSDLKNKFKVTFEKNNIFEVEIKSLKEYYSLPRLITKYMEAEDVNIYFNS